MQLSWNFDSSIHTLQRIYKTYLIENRIDWIIKFKLFIQQTRVRLYNIKIQKEAHMAKIGKQKIDELIGQMSHYDPDNMEMGAKRLTELILSGDVNLESDPKIANTIRQAYMKQIESSNDTVQSQAIKYLAEIVPKLPSEQVQFIYEKILEHITNLTEQEKKRERYGACAATVIHQAAQQYGKQMGNLFLKSIKKLLEFKDKKTQLQIILISIITEFIKKWPNVASHLAYDRKGLVLYLLKNIEVKSKLDIIKKSQACLGKLALILDRDLIHLTLNENDWGLLKFIERTNGKTTLENLKHSRNGLLCLSQIIKTHNIQIRFWAKDISNLLIKIINHFKNHDDIDNIEVICDILDASLTTLSYLIKTFNRELKDQLQLKENRFNSFIKDLLYFNVQGMMTYAGEEIQDETYQQNDDYYQQAQVDEKCWKVRRSVLFYISFLARYDRHFIEGLKQGELIEDLGMKLVEEHSMVSQMAFFTFNELIELISIDRALTNDQVEIEELNLQRVKSSALQIADDIIKEISIRIKIIFNNSKFNDQLKIQSSKILLKLVQIYNHILINKEQETFGLINFIVQQLKKTNINQKKGNLLNCLRELVSSDYPFQKYEYILAYYFETISTTNNVKLQNICLNGIRKFTDIFKQDISKKGAYFARLVDLLKAKIKQLDSDKIVKIAVCRCLSVLLQNYVLFDEDIVYFFNYLTEKLKIEVQKVYLIDCLIHVNKQTKLTANSVRSLQAVIVQVAQNLGSNNYELNVKSIEAINQLLSIIRGSVSQKLLEYLLTKSKLMLGQGKIPSFFRYITDKNPKLLKPYAEQIVKSTQSFYIALMIKQGVIDVNSCLRLLKQLDQEKGKRISQTLGAIKLDINCIIKQIDQTAWGRVLVGSLGYLGDDTMIPTLFGYINNFKSDEAKSQACSAIGNIISRYPDKLIPGLINQANSATQVYTYIYIIKEMLSFSQKSFSNIIFLIEWLLSISQSHFEAQSNYFITSECVGKLAFLDNQAALKVISNSKSPNQNRRLIVASSLRFGLQNRNTFQFQFLQNYIDTIISLTADSKYRVREGAIKSLISVGQIYIKGLKHYSSDKNFWRNIIANSRIDDSLIVTIDYGICKEVRDDGKNLRLQTFNLLQILVKKIHLEPQNIEELLETSLHRINQQNSNDISLKRLSVIKNLCQLDFAPFLRFQKDFILRINPKEGLLKRYEKNNNQEERTQIYMRGILKQILDINSLAKEQNVQHLGAFIVQLRNHPIFSSVLEQLDKAAK